MGFLKKMTMLTFGSALVCWAGAAHADLSQIKAYKEAFADSKPKCIDCHTQEHPKKEDGQHDNNAYGKAAVQAAGGQKPTADAYTKIGKIENFKQ